MLARPWAGGKSIPPPSPSSRELPGTLLPQQIPRPHKSLTQLLVLRPEVKACRSAQGLAQPRLTLVLGQFCSPSCTPIS